MPQFSKDDADNRAHIYKRDKTSYTDCKTTINSEGDASVDNNRKATEYNGNIIRIPRCLLIGALIFCVLVVLTWLYFVHLNIKDSWGFVLENISNVVGALASIVLIVFGYRITNDGAFSKGGTEFYPRSYLRVRVDLAIKGKNDKYKNKQKEIIETIDKLNSQNDKKKNDSEYYKIVGQLLNKDFAFFMAWNNLNFYGGVRSPSKSIFEHTSRVRGEPAKIKDNLLRWKERKEGPEIGGRKWERSGRNTTKISRRMRSSYRMQVQRR